MRRQAKVNNLLPSLETEILGREFTIFVENLFNFVSDNSENMGILSLKETQSPPQTHAHFNAIFFLPIDRAPFERCVHLAHADIALSHFKAS